MAGLASSLKKLIHGLRTASHSFAQLRTATRCTTRLYPNSPYPKFTLWTTPSLPLRRVSPSEQLQRAVGRCALSSGPLVTPEDCTNTD